jgi:virulence factor Mce-like protein
MRRIAGILLVCALGAFAVLAGGASDDDGKKSYSIEFDNAFGLIKGGDLKVAGVRAGVIGEIELNRANNRAIVGIDITELGFGSLRTDVRCEVRPQSLIGEYFIDCLPGSAPRELPEGARIPVEQTASTVPPDLVNNVLRKPYRERLSLIVNELGAAVAGNSGNLNAAVKRAAPALRETNKVLKVLGDQNTVLRDLVANADRVVGDLAGNRKDVSRWIDEAGETAVASAERRDDIAASFRRLPGFLEELEPTMASLGKVAENQTPALRDLNASAGQLERLFDQLEPFADASRPAFKALGEASLAGRQAVRNARPTVAQLGKFTKQAPELGKNLAIILEHLDDREWAVEADPRSPGGKGYTGLEALLAYVYDQTLSTNVYDSNVHYLKVSPFTGQCAAYADIQRIKDTPGLEEECGARVGPNAIGINFPDPTKPAGAEARRKRVGTQHKTDRGPSAIDDRPLGFQEPAPEKPKKVLPVVPKIDLPEILPGIDIPPIKLPGIGDLTGKDGPLLGRERASAPSRDTQLRLLDYLLGSG